jgi:hypothetical protein
VAAARWVLGKRDPLADPAAHADRPARELRL